MHQFHCTYILYTFNLAKLSHVSHLRQLLQKHQNLPLLT